MRRGAVIVALCCLLALAPGVKPVSATAPEMESSVVLLMDTGTKTILASQEIHKKVYPASITKIMTLLLAMEALAGEEVGLNDMVTVSQRAEAMGGSTIFLDNGDQVRLEDLLIGISVASGNDAAVAVAEHLAGSVEAFVDRMNERARELGMRNTRFANPHGLHDENHYTTAYDISLMSLELLKYPAVHRWMAIWLDEHFLEGQIRAGEVYLSNTNRMIYDYQGCDGLKTGFTQEAGHCIVATARRGDTRFLAVVMQGETAAQRYSDARALLDYAFQNYINIPVKQGAAPVGDIPVEKGCAPNVGAVTAGDLTLLLPKGEDSGLEEQLTLPERLVAPVAAGEIIGRLAVVKDGEEIGATEIVAATDVPRAGMIGLLVRILSRWMNFGR